MNKFVFILLSVLLMPAKVVAMDEDPIYDFEVDGLCYMLDANTSSATLTYRNDKYACYNGDIVVPEQITIGNDTYIVTSIGTKIFENSVFSYKTLCVLLVWP